MSEHKGVGSDDTTPQKVEGTVNTWDNGDVAYGCLYPIALVVIVLFFSYVFPLFT